MTAYILKLVILLPLMGGLIFAALWLYKKYQPALMGAQKDKSLKLLEIVPLSNLSKLAVVDFEGRKILLSVSKNGVNHIAEDRVQDA
ncbi:hypothetical protein MNBD_ALPHA04-1931 [hydrothermal vent metagenome]|uniref:Flagellar biosynthesis protein FliO n=1 Tax=hydrothermal vent metagenome TaxID=652676 RepID=A0A3B0RI52_9ZZZZ